MSCSRCCSGMPSSLAPLKPRLIAQTAGQSLPFSRRVCGLWWKPGCWSVSVAPTTRPNPSTACRCRPRYRSCWRLASIGCHPRTSACSGRRRSSAPRCPYSLLQAIAEVPEEALYRSLTHLQAAEFLYETPPLSRAGLHLQACPDARGGIRQPPAGAAAGAACAPGRGPRALAPERVAEQVERLAHHALRGEVWDKAVIYCQQAGARPATAPRSARRWPLSTQALQALAHLTEPQRHQEGWPSRSASR